MLPDMTISCYDGSIPASGGLTRGGGMIVPRASRCVDIPRVLKERKQF